MTTTDKGLKISFKNTAPLASFWIAVKKNEYPELAEVALNFLLPFHSYIL